MVCVFTPVVHLVNDGVPIMWDEYTELVNFYVKIKLNKSSCARYGHVLTVDPGSGAVMLEEDQSVSCLPAHSIESISKEGDEPRPMPNTLQYCDAILNKPIMRVDNQLEMMQRRSRLVAYLGENNIPVEEIDDLLIAAYSVSITPPYTQTDCKSCNAIVLNKIKTALEHFYRDYSSSSQ